LMNQATLEERHWFLRNMAIGLVSHLGVSTPPVWIEIPYDLSLDERRFALARETMIVMCGCQYGRHLGLPEFIFKDFWDSQNYFARVLLAPDQLVDAYRRQGRDLRGFAETFLIPPRIATIRWQDPLFL
jgi:hypothetical protein